MHVLCAYTTIYINICIGMHSYRNSFLGITYIHLYHACMRHYIYTFISLNIYVIIKYIRLYHVCMRAWNAFLPFYALATISRLLKIIGLFCKRAL